MENRYFAYPGDVGTTEPDHSAVELGLLSGADEADWSLLFDYGERMIVQPGESIIERGTFGRSIFIVVTGTFRVIAPASRRGRERVVSVLDAGAVVGEVGFAIGGPRSHTITAQTTSEVFSLDWEAFERLAAAHPKLGVRILRDVLRIVAARTRAAER